jgi:hypothetical protein
MGRRRTPSEQGKEAASFEDTFHFPNSLMERPDFSLLKVNNALGIIRSFSGNSTRREGSLSWVRFPSGPSRGLTTQVNNAFFVVFQGD